MVRADGVLQPYRVEPSARGPRLRIGAVEVRGLERCVDQFLRFTRHHSDSPVEFVNDRASMLRNVRFQCAAELQLPVEARHVIELRRRVEQRLSLGREHRRGAVDPVLVVRRVPALDRVVDRLELDE